MIRGNVTTYGSAVGHDGLPGEYHSYMVWASKHVARPGEAVASIISFTGGEQTNRYVSSDTERAAFEKAVALVRSLPETRGLQFDLREDQVS